MQNNTRPTLRPSNIPSDIRTIFVPPQRDNYVLYNGKYFSTLGDITVDDYYQRTSCQTDSFYVPNNWVLAPDDADSLQVIYSYAWSTSTVIVSSGVGYNSASTFGSINKAYINWLLTSGSTLSGYKYNCAQCPCQILIMYTPLPPTIEPTRLPYTFSDDSSLSVGHVVMIVVFPVIFLVVVCAVGCYFLAKYRRQMIQVQETFKQQLQSQLPVNGYGQPPQPQSQSYPGEEPQQQQGHGYGHPVYGYEHSQPHSHPEVPSQPQVDGRYGQPPQQTQPLKQQPPGGADYHAQPPGSYNPGGVYPAVADPMTHAPYSVY